MEQIDLSQEMKTNRKTNKLCRMNKRKESKTIVCQYNIKYFQNRLFTLFLANILCLFSMKISSCRILLTTISIFE